MRLIRVKNASILSTLAGHEIDFEIRSSKHSKGLALAIDGVKIIDLDATDSGTLMDGQNYSGPTLFSLYSVKSNGCLSAIRVEDKRIIIQ